MALKLKHRLFALIHEKEGREGRRITQQEVAERTKISAHTISIWMKNDVTRFDASVIERLCEYFECGVGDLLYVEQVEQTQDKG